MYSLAKPESTTSLIPDARQRVDHSAALHPRAVLLGGLAGHGAIIRVADAHDTEGHAVGRPARRPGR